MILAQGALAISFDASSVIYCYASIQFLVVGIFFIGLAVVTDPCFLRYSIVLCIVRFEIIFCIHLC